MSRVPLFSFILLAACSSPLVTDTGSPDAGVAVAAGSVGWLEPSGALPTLATVRWSTPGPVQGQVCVREAGQKSWIACIEEAAPAEEHSQLLRGLAADTDYEIAIEPNLEEVGVALELELTTGALPEWMPEFVAEVDPEAGTPEGYIAVSMRLDDSPTGTAVIFDMDGRPAGLVPPGARRGDPRAGDP